MNNFFVIFLSVIWNRLKNLFDAIYDNLVSFSYPFWGTLYSYQQSQKHSKFYKSHQFKGNYFAKQHYIKTHPWTIRISVLLFLFYIGVAVGLSPFPWFVGVLEGIPHMLLLVVRFTIFLCLYIFILVFVPLLSGWFGNLISDTYTEIQKRKNNF